MFPTPIKHFTVFALIFLLTACSTSSIIDVETGNEISDRRIITDSEMLNHEEISAFNPWTVPQGDVNYLRNSSWDLQHQKIWVSFDFTSKEVHGSTELFFTSKNDATSELILDSKTTQIRSLKDVSSQRELSFVQDSALVRIPLDSLYSWGDSLYIRIDYTATPPHRGLYFVGPTEQNPQKPVQVWTLGQPEDNSFWLPTIDHPAERTTTELWIRVPENFTTVSNGKLMRSAVEAGDSLRTDYWVMDKPHAPYLIALAVGEYVSAQQLHRDVVLSFYGESDFAPYLGTIYKDTDTMLSYFEDQLDYAYPWGTYAQVPVRDFIARGMENTAASFYFEQLQITDRQQLDISYQDLLVHELIHQWFGNLVTTEDWANLPLNEGIANYFETLFREFKDGSSRARIKIQEDRAAYFTEAKSKRRPVIFNRYTVPEDMYDRHTYEKMGLILRQYHNMIGDDLWWEGLRHYLKENQFDSVNWTNLRDAFRAVTGKDHDWYWEQWLLDLGHPELVIDYDFSGTNPKVFFRQTQEQILQPLFKLVIPVSYTDKSGIRYDTVFTFNESHASFEIPLASDSVSLVEVDPERYVLAEYLENISLTDWISRLNHPSELLRYEAVLHLINNIPENNSLIPILMQRYDSELSPEIRFQILNGLRPYLNINDLNWIHRINEDSEDYYLVRILAADISADLAGLRGNEYLESLRHDKSYYVEKHIVNLLDQ